MNRSNSVILAIDQGTSGSKAIFFDIQGKIVCKAVVKQHTTFPEEGFVEQEPEELVKSVRQAVSLALEKLLALGYSQGDILCCGISNQRETFILWDKKGKPLHQAVVWQCKRSIDICRRLKKENMDSIVSVKTGLLIDPYFSATKLVWLKENIPPIASAIENGRAFFGTVDTWLLYNLTDGQSYKTDFTNASRTMFFNLSTLQWDKELIDYFGLNKLRLPKICPSNAFFGQTDFSGILKKKIPVTALCGDSHAAAFGERCFHPGSVKITLGTGSSILLNTGKTRTESRQGLVTTVCWSTKDIVQYALEGIIVSCGATMTWMKESLGLFDNDKEGDKIAESLQNSGGIYIIPAFSGLGAPFWKMNLKAQIHGLTYASTRGQLIRAGLESIPFQIAAIMKSMVNESGSSLQTVKVDGGLSSSDLITRSIATLLNTTVDKANMKENSALGAALLAGLGNDTYASLDELENLEYDVSSIECNANTDILNSYREWLSIITSLK